MTGKEQYSAKNLAKMSLNKLRDAFGELTNGFNNTDDLFEACETNDLILDIKVELAGRVAHNRSDGAKFLVARTMALYNKIEDFQGHAVNQITHLLGILNAKIEAQHLIDFPPAVEPVKVPTVAELRDKYGRTHPIYIEALAKAAKTPMPTVAKASTVHIFNPDHNLYCIDCGEGELVGNHGITAIVEAEQVYADLATSEMYENAYETTNNEFYNRFDSTFLANSNKSVKVPTEKHPYNDLSGNGYCFDCGLQASHPESNHTEPADDPDTIVGTIPTVQDTYAVIKRQTQALKDIINAASNGEPYSNDELQQVFIAEYEVGYKLLMQLGLYEDA